MADSRIDTSNRPALIVVDMQEDFCPPQGSLAVTGAREIASMINDLTLLPFHLKIATQDFHPQDHVSFDSSHPSPNIKAFQSSVNISNPYKESQSQKISVWPPHCIQQTPGVEIIPEVDVSRFHHVMQKGKDSRVEMFSAFADVFGNKSPAAASMDLTETLKDVGIRHVFIAGIAGDHCVRCTALDAKKEGFEVFVIEEATKCVDMGEGWDSAKEQMRKAGIHIIRIDGPELEVVSNRSRG